MKHEEFKMCKAFWRDVQLTYPGLAEHMTHFPAGEKRTQRDGAKLKIMGTRPGCPDYYCDMPMLGYHGLRIEAKIPGGRVTPDQKAVITRLREQGYAVAVCYGLDSMLACAGAYAMGVPHPDDMPEFHTITEAEQRKWTGETG